MWLLKKSLEPCVPSAAVPRPVSMSVLSRRVRMAAVDTSRHTFPKYHGALANPDADASGTLGGTAYLKLGTGEDTHRIKARTLGRAARQFVNTKFATARHIQKATRRQISV